LAELRHGPCLALAPRRPLFGRGAPAAPPELKTNLQACSAQLVTLDVIGQPVTLSEREAEELRHAAAADAGRSTARRDLSVLLDRGLRAKTTVVLNRAEARELAELLTADGFSTNLALLREALLLALASA
jgi:hypothetical protein